MSNAKDCPCGGIDCSALPGGPMYDCPYQKVVDLTARRPTLLARRDKCPKCRGELDTGWECNDCGFDAYELVHGHAFTPDPPLS